MLFNSYIFILGFLPVALLGYFLLGRISTVAPIWWLLAVSLFFYGWWDPRYLALMMSSIVFNYLVSVGMRSGRQGLALLVVGIVANLAVLVYFKYLGFFAQALNAFGVSGFEVPEILLPLAISFFTFQQIAYIVDVYRGDITRPSFVAYASFVTLFPHLIAGPIVRHSELLPQLTQRLGRFDVRLFSLGLTAFAIGLFKKVCIADTLAPLVKPVFDAADAGGAVGFADAWSGALSYTFQLYFDFSGYSDMAIGLALMFGFILPINFWSPYKSVNMIEFWRRWHITLGRFVRDYIYIPLGGNRHGPARQQLSLLFAMALIGLWHGAGWTFLAWGIYHGMLLTINHVWRSVFTPVPKEAPAHQVRHAASVALTFLCVVAGWVLFRAETFSGAWTLLSAMAGVGDVTRISGEIVQPLAALPRAALLGGLLGLVLAAPNTFEIIARGAKLSPAPMIDFRSIGLRPDRRLAIASGLLLALALGSLSNVSEFLYFRF